MATDERYRMLEFISANTNYNITAFEDHGDDVLFRMCERIKTCLGTYPEQIYNTCKKYGIQCESLEELRKLNYNVLSDMRRRLKKQTGGVIVKSTRSILPAPTNAVTGAYVAKKEPVEPEELISDPQYLSREELPNDMKDLSQKELLDHGIITDQDQEAAYEKEKQAEYYDSVYALSEMNLEVLDKPLDFMTLLTLSPETINKFMSFIYVYKLDPNFEDGIKSISSFYQGPKEEVEEVEQLSLYDCGLIPPSSRIYGKEENLENQLFKELLAAKISINGERITRRYLSEVPYITLERLYELVVSLNKDLKAEETKRLTKK